MKRLYRLQQRLSLSRPEATGLLVLLSALIMGLVIEPWLPSEAPLAIAQYAEADRLFAAHTEGTTPGGLAVAPPAKADAVNDAAGEAMPAAGQPLINLNTATAAELEQLPRIGPKLAERILAYRAAQGAFSHASDLVAVKGIGEKTMAQLAPLVTVADN